MAGTIKTKKEIDILRIGGAKLAMILESVLKQAKPGISTLALDRLGESLIFEFGGKPSFKGYKIKESKISYPGSLCISVNDEVVHAIPKEDKFLKEGDVVGFDIGMKWPAQEGLFTDMAVSIGIGKISERAKKLIEVTARALEIGIEKVRDGVRTGDIGNAIQKYLEKNNLGIIRELAGHGVGYKVHEEPYIPNYGKPGTGAELKEGMVIAIEPMATLGDYKVKLQEDDWTFKTADGSLSAHFEHTMAVTKNGVEILTK